MNRKLKKKHFLILHNRRFYVFFNLEKKIFSLKLDNGIRILYASICRWTAFEHREQIVINVACILHKKGCNQQQKSNDISMKVKML